MQNLHPNLSGADLSGTNLSNVNLSQANLSGTNLGRADLRWAYLYGADLTGANLRGAYLTEADLRGANLGRADLRGAYLYGADLNEAMLHDVSFQETASASGVLMPEAPGTVAVVDDDPAVLDSLKFLLEVAGFPVATYSSAAAFLETGRDRSSCLVLDHHMPQMTGLQLAAKLRAEGSRLPILLITGSPSPAIVAQAAQAGVKLLEKPPSEEDLLEFVTAFR